jgi:hypothetical protein
VSFFAPREHFPEGGGFTLSIFHYYQQVMAFLTLLQMVDWVLPSYLHLIKRGISFPGGQFWFHPLVFRGFSANGDS